MKVAVLGSTGMLGSMVAGYLSRYFEVKALARPDFDALNPDWAKLEDCDWVINCIGAIPQRVKDEDTLYQINTVFPRYLSEHSRRLIHATTDCVFSGETGYYTEDSPSDTACDDVYGASKWFGEVHAKHALNLRCSLIGPESHGKSLLGWFLSQPQGATVNGYINHLWNGITTLQFARICKGIMGANTQNFWPTIQHVIPADWVSKRELLAYAKVAFHREDIAINPMLTEKAVRRQLATVYPETNKLLWQGAGYSEIPTVKQMVQELAEYKLGVTV